MALKVEDLGQQAALGAGLRDITDGLDQWRWLIVADRAIVRRS